MSNLSNSTVKNLKSFSDPASTVKKAGKRKHPKRIRVSRRYSFPEEDEFLSSREKMELLDTFNDDE